jgi:hypothetical protein
MLIKNMATLNGKYYMNDDVLTMLYNIVIDEEDKYEYILSNEENNALILETVKRVETLRLSLLKGICE